MSNRFTVNDFQPFSNNELGKRTHKELCRQGIKWIENGWYCKRQKIKDPNALLEAIYQDTMEDLIDRIKRTRKNKGLDVGAPITDEELYGSPSNIMSSCLLTKNGELRESGWYYAGSFLEDKVVFATYFTYLAMLPSCTLTFDEYGSPYLTIKKNRAVWVEMY